MPITSRPTPEQANDPDYWEAEAVRILTANVCGQVEAIRAQAMASLAVSQRLARLPFAVVDAMACFEPCESETTKSR